MLQVTHHVPRARPMHARQHRPLPFVRKRHAIEGHSSAPFAALLAKIIFFPIGFEDILRGYFIDFQCYFNSCFQ